MVDHSSVFLVQVYIGGKPWVLTVPASSPTSRRLLAASPNLDHFTVKTSSPSGPSTQIHLGQVVQGADKLTQFQLAAEGVYLAEEH